MNYISVKLFFEKGKWILNAFSPSLIDLFIAFLDYERYMG